MAPRPCRAYGLAMPRSPDSSRVLRLALRRGVRCVCPACGESRLFTRFLKPVSRCPSCREDWSTRTADDFPAYLVILLLGHLLVPMVVEANLWLDIPTGFQMLFWPSLAAALALLMIQPAKGFVMALQWAR